MSFYFYSRLQLSGGIFPIGNHSGFYQSKQTSSTCKYNTFAVIFKFYSPFSPIKIPQTIKPEGFYDYSLRAMFI